MNKCIMKTGLLITTMSLGVFLVQIDKSNARRNNGAERRLSRRNPHVCGTRVGMKARKRD